MTLEQVEHFLKEPVHTGLTPPPSQFDPKCLLDDLSRDPDWKPLEENRGGPLPRDYLYFYLNQNNRYAELAKGVDKTFNDPAWKNFPPTIIVHGDKDDMVLLEASEKVVSVTGES